MVVCAVDPETKQQYKVDETELRNSFIYCNFCQDYRYYKNKYGCNLLVVFTNSFMNSFRRFFVF